MSERRIVAVVLSQLLYELAREQRRLSSQGEKSISKSTPVAIVLGDALNTEALNGEAHRETTSVRTELNGQGPPREKGKEEETTAPNSIINAVNEAAHGYGVRTGQSVSEARAWVAHLQVLRISPSEVQQELERVAESLSCFAPTISIGYPDTLWLDITGAAHLFDGEPNLLRELSTSLSNLGHFCRLAIARGPVLARAFAHWASANRGQAGVIVEESKTKEYVGELPIVALPVGSDVHAWLAQLGLLQFSDLSELPRAQLASRLGSDASQVLDLLDGRDTCPLEAFVPAELPSETLSWEEAVAGRDPLLFALRGLTSKLSARLEGRRLAVQALRIVIEHDRTIARFRQVEPEVSLPCQLASPLSRSDDLWRIISSKIGQAELDAPSIGVRLEVEALTVAPKRQLDLLSSTSRLDPTNPERLQLLLSELATELGPDQFGILSIENSHRPEKLSRLKPVEVCVGAHRTASSIRGARLGQAFSFDSKPTSRRSPPKKKKRRPEQITFESANVMTALKKPESTALIGTFKSQQSQQLPWQATDRAVPNRLLQEPIMLTGPVETGALLAFGGQLYSIREVTFEYRLDSVEWWSGQNIARDYLRVRLSASCGQLEALIYKNRITGRAFLQALYD